MNTKRKMRHLLDWVLMIVIAGSFSMLSFVGWLWYGGYNPHTLNETLNKLGYYEHQYEQFWGVLNTYLEQIQIPEEAINQDDIRTRFLVESKQAVIHTELSNLNLDLDMDAEIDGDDVGDVEVDTDAGTGIDIGNVYAGNAGSDSEFDDELNRKWNAGTEVADQIRLYLEEQGIVLTEKAELGLSKMEENITQLANMFCVNPQIQEWQAERETLKNEFPKLLIGTSAILGICILLLILIQHKKTRAFWYLGIGSLISGGWLLCVCLTGQFFGAMECLMKESLLMSGYAIGGFECGAGVLCMLFSRLYSVIRGRV